MSVRALRQHNIANSLKPQQVLLSFQNHIALVNTFIYFFKAGILSLTNKFGYSVPPYFGMHPLTSQYPKDYFLHRKHNMDKYPKIASTGQPCTILCILHLLGFSVPIFHNIFLFYPEKKKIEICKFLKNCHIINQYQIACAQNPVKIHIFNLKPLFYFYFFYE